MMHLLRRMLRVLTSEGVPGVVQRLNERRRRQISYIHLTAFASSPGSCPANSQSGQRQPLSDVQLMSAERQTRASIEFKQLSLNDEEEIDELTEADPWKISKSASFEKLREGWLCFVAKKEGRAVACAWPMTGGSFRDEFLRRDFALGPAEAYYWRCFCASECRGAGIFPQLLAHVVAHLRCQYGKSQHLALVRSSNAAMRHSLGKIGWKPVGRAGFVEILGVRFSYLWGREAFKETKKRFFVEL
jgi:hypothetical protein